MSKRRTGADAIRCRTPTPACSRPLPPAPVLRIELSEILRVHLLEVLLELVGVEPGTGRGLVGFHSRLIQKMVAREDGGPEAQGQRDAVGGAGVDLKDVVVAPDEQL